MEMVCVVSEIKTKNGLIYELNSNSITFLSNIFLTKVILQEDNPISSNVL